MFAVVAAKVPSESLAKNQYLISVTMGRMSVVDVQVAFFPSGKQIVPPGTTNVAYGFPPGSGQVGLSVLGKQLVVQNTGARWAAGGSVNAAGVNAVGDVLRFDFTGATTYPYAAFFIQCPDPSLGITLSLSAQNAAAALIPIGTISAESATGWSVVMSTSTTVAVSCSSNPQNVVCWVQFSCVASPMSVLRIRSSDATVTTDSMAIAFASAGNVPQAACMAGTTRIHRPDGSTIPLEEAFNQQKADGKPCEVKCVRVSDGRETFVQAWVLKSTAAFCHAGDPRGTKGFVVSPGVVISKDHLYTFPLLEEEGGSNEGPPLAMGPEVQVMPPSGPVRYAVPRLPPDDVPKVYVAPWDWYHLAPLVFEDASSSWVVAAVAHGPPCLLEWYRTPLQIASEYGSWEIPSLAATGTATTEA